MKKQYLAWAGSRATYGKPHEKRANMMCMVSFILSTQEKSAICFVINLITVLIATQYQRIKSKLKRYSLLDTHKRNLKTI